LSGACGKEERWGSIEKSLAKGERKNSQSTQSPSQGWTQITTTLQRLNRRTANRHKTLRKVGCNLRKPCEGHLADQQISCPTFARANSQIGGNMSNSNEVLNMIAEGKINADEGLKLLQAMNAPRKVATTTDRWLHVRVSDLTSNRQRVNINLPTSWIEAGLRIGRNFAPELHDVDWQQISDAVKAGSAGRLLEVEDLDDNQRVEIFVD
jgi:hypothetical protein